MCCKSLLWSLIWYNNGYVFMSKLNVNGSILYSFKHRPVQKKNHTNEHSRSYASKKCLTHQCLFKHELAVAFPLLWCWQSPKKCPLIVHSTMKCIWFSDRASVFCWTMRHTSVCAAAAPTLSLFQQCIFGGGLLALIAF